MIQNNSIAKGMEYFIHHMNSQFMRIVIYLGHTELMLPSVLLIYLVLMKDLCSYLGIKIIQWRLMG